MTFRVSSLPCLLAALLVALLTLPARPASAERSPRLLLLRRPLSLRTPALASQPTFTLAPNSVGDVSWELPLPTPAMRRGSDSRARPPSEEVLFAPLRDLWSVGALRRSEGAANEGDKKPVTDQLLSQVQVGAIGLVASAFIPNGQVYAVHSETLRGTIHFTPTTFSGTGAGIRLWGDFW